MSHVRIGCRAVAAAILVCILCTPQSTRAGEPPPGTLLRCRGVLDFADALSRAATVFVDLDRAQIYTPDCRKYPHLEGYCSGVLLDIAEHSFQFGGAVSRENTKFWADLHRRSTMVSATAGPVTEAMRVLFIGRCEPIHARRAGRLKLK